MSENSEGLAGGNGKALGIDHVGTLIAPESKPSTARSQAQAYAFHPLADLFPLIEGREFEDLVADIKANGLIEDIVLYDGMILDGRNRYRACIAADVPPMVHDATKWIEDPAAYVVSANIRRRHLTHGQKRGVIAKLLAAHPEKSDRQIAETVKASPTTVGTVRAEMESTVQIGQLPKRVGKDGKARKRPQSRTARRQVRLDRRKERFARERASEVVRAAAAANADDDEHDEEDDAALTAAAVRGFIYRAREARDNATYEGFIGSDITEAMIDAADDAAAAWSMAAQKLRGMVGQNPLIDAWDKATRAQRHEFIMARKLEVMRELAHEPTTAVPVPDDGASAVMVDDFSDTLAARMRQGESTGAPDDPFEIPPMFDRTGGQR